MPGSYQDLRAWQEAMDLAVGCYRYTRSFPRSEVFGLAAQIRAAASSIAANIAEGWGRGTPADYARFLRMAQGSLKELETHLILAGRVDISELDNAPLLERCSVVGRLLGGLLRVVTRASDAP